MLTGECPKIGIVYVSASGMNSVDCGGVGHACLSVDYVFANRLNTSGKIYVSAPGEFGVSCRGPADYQVVFEGIGIPFNAEEADYPGLYPANNGDIWLNTSNDVQMLTIVNFRIIVPASGFTGYLFRTKAPHATTIIMNCFIYYNSSSTDFVMPRGIYGDSGYLTFANVVVRGLTFNGVGFLKMDYPGPNCFYSFVNCSFSSILQKGSDPAVFHFNHTAGYYQVENCSFVNITHSGPFGGRGALIDYPLDTSLSQKISNLYFANVDAKQHVFRFSGVSASFTVRNFVFNNVTSNTIGGAMYIIGNTPATILTFVDSVFSKCVTMQGYGGFICWWISYNLSFVAFNLGGIYSEGISIYLNGCKFDGNSATTSGKDIYVANSQSIIKKLYPLIETFLFVLFIYLFNCFFSIR
jgi:hypothetical protein